MRKQELFKKAHEEFKVTRQVSTGNGSLYCGQVTGPTAPSDVPGWFIRDELGYDGPCGLRLHVMVPQGALDARHRRAAQREAVPPPVARKASKKSRRETKASRHAKLQQLAARALAMRHAA